MVRQVVVWATVPPHTTLYFNASEVCNIEWNTPKEREEDPNSDRYVVQRWKIPTPECCHISIDYITLPYTSQTQTINLSIQGKGHLRDYWSS
jgi:hypothetical protein